MEEFPGNRQQRPRRQDERPSSKKVEKVVQNEVVRRKKPRTRRLFEHIIGESPKDTFNHVAFEILIPAIKDGFLDSFHESIDGIFGNDRSSYSRRRRRSGGGSYVSYDRYSKRDSRDEPRALSRRARSHHDFDEIILSSRVEAEEVIDQLYEIVSKYEAVSVADLYNLVGVTGAHTDEKWGWTDIRGAGVTRLNRGGYLLDLPRPEPLD